MTRNPLWLLVFLPGVIVAGFVLHAASPDAQHAAPAPRPSASPSRAPSADEIAVRIGCDGLAGTFMGTPVAVYAQEAGQCNTLGVLVKTFATRELAEGNARECLTNGDPLLVGDNFVISVYYSPDGDLRGQLAAIQGRIGGVIRP